AGGARRIERGCERRGVDGPHMQSEPPKLPPRLLSHASRTPQNFENLLSRTIHARANMAIVPLYAVRTRQPPHKGLNPPSPRLLGFMCSFNLAPPLNVMQRRVRPC